MKLSNIQVETQEQFISKIKFSAFLIILITIIEYKLIFQSLGIYNLWLIVYFSTPFKTLIFLNLIISGFRFISNNQILISAFTLATFAMQICLIFIFFVIL